MRFNFVLDVEKSTFNDIIDSISIIVKKYEIFDLDINNLAVMAISLAIENLTSTSPEKFNSISDNIIETIIPEIEEKTNTTLEFLPKEFTILMDVVDSLNHNEELIRVSKDIKTLMNANLTFTEFYDFSLIKDMLLLRINLGE